jgi:hypothetical protein
MKTVMLVCLPSQMSEDTGFESEAGNILRGASPEHIEILYHAGITKFEHLQSYRQDSGTLLLCLQQLIAGLQFGGSSLTMQLVRDWITQAESKPAGNPIKRPPIDVFIEGGGELAGGPTVDSRQGHGRLRGAMGFRERHPIQCREGPGELLKYYERKAAWVF